MRFTRMDTAFLSGRAPIIVGFLWMKFQTIDFMRDKRREKLFDLDSEESKFTIVL